MHLLCEERKKYIMEREKKKNMQHPLGSIIIIHLVFFFLFRRLRGCQLPEELSSGYFVLITTKELKDFNAYFCLHKLLGLTHSS